ncbi:type VI secretion system-associated FHA domain protein TagH [Simiduia agarivorans]|uniref:FHA domain-containing protein n=1 Tax=Simiduia agarivorans (strain DSM 21679 / JCM 13881 / BCRC 17597 / SA1) TaxID=1117647 RepID=K4KVX6_SIMAS|nr:type VI secretion system-associated FHA domain protein TagH [Simiduia agarivorans]AFU98087.1 FHA domain-containing protein [Simiduia agarivorans SA1 = DSM 21679]
MDLILTIIADPDGTNMINHTKVFTQSGGAIGRADKNDWILPDPGRIVSSQHAAISFKDAHYWLTDTSTNGLFLNDGTTPLGPGAPHKMVDGDIFAMGEYKVRVSIRPPKHDPNHIPDGLGTVDFLDESDKTQFSAGMAGALTAQKQASQFDDLLDSPSTPAHSQSQQWGFVNQEEASTPSHEAISDPMALFSSPTPTPGNSDWDDDWWKEGSTADNAVATSHAVQTPHIVKPVPQPSSPPAAIPTSALQAAAGRQPMTGQSMEHSQAATLSQEANPFAASRQLLDGAAPPPTQPVPPAKPVQQSSAPVTTNPQASQAQRKVADAGAAVSIAQALGLTDLPAAAQVNIPTHAVGIIRETVNRLIDLLRARNTIKNELRVQRTMIQTTDNNPLKFSANEDDALRTLFGQNTSAFLSPVAAVQDSFDDLSDHQVAVLAGTRAAYKAMLNHFAPDRLASRFGQSGSLLASKGAKNWAAYCEHYKELLRDTETTYDDLFGEEFAAAYEKQLTDLKNARALSKRNRSTSA